MFQSTVTECARLQKKIHEWLEQSTLRNVKVINSLYNGTISEKTSCDLLVDHAS